MTDDGVTKCDITKATHVKYDGTWHKIKSKWGVSEDGLQPPSKGGFGCVLEDETTISMWEADAYGKE